MRPILPKIAVADDRPRKELTILGTGGQTDIYRLFPDLEAAVTLYLAETLTRDYPELVEALQAAPVSLSVSIRALSGVRVPDHGRAGGSRIRISYDLVVFAPAGAQRTFQHQWTSEIAPAAGRELEALGAEIQRNLRRRARVIVDSFVHKVLPLLPPPEDPAYSASAGL